MSFQCCGTAGKSLRTFCGIHIAVSLHLQVLSKLVVYLTIRSRVSAFLQMSGNVPQLDEAELL